MVHRHPHVFGDTVVKDSAEVLANWAQLKKEEKKGKEWMDEELPAAFDESLALLEKKKAKKLKKLAEARLSAETQKSDH